MIHHFSIERPRPNETIYDECISITGSFVLTDQAPVVAPHICALLDNACIGETQFVAVRGPDTRRYRLLARLPGGLDVPRDALIEIVASWKGNGAQCKIGEVSVHLLPAALRQLPYGERLCPQCEEVLHRKNIYGSGLPLEQPSGEMLQLLLDYLPSDGTVVDVGCGAGAYGPGLIAAGHRWLGLETNPRCWEMLAQRQLPFRRIEGQVVLPCASAEFDHAICIEVLEHVAEPENFLREIARIIRIRALFSVPNIEVIPYFRSWEVVPWHLLEANHTNFFTRGSFAKLLKNHFRHVEIFSCAEHPLPTRDGIPLHAHLFAIAEK